MKSDHERRTIENFIAHVERSRGRAYQIIGEDVPVPSGENYDYRLGPTRGDGREIAVELVRLVDSEEEMQNRRRLRCLWDSLTKELERLGAAGLHVRTPPRVDLTERDIAPLCTRIAPQLLSIPANGSEPVSVEGFSAHRVEGLTGPVMSTQTTGWLNGLKAANDQLARNLPRKGGKLPVSGAMRVVVFSNWSSWVDFDEVLQAAASLPSAQYDNIDEVWLEDRGGTLRLIFDRTLLAAVELGEPIPQDPLARELFVSWLLNRLAAKTTGTLEKVLELVEGADPSGQGLLSPVQRAAIIQAALDRAELGEVSVGLRVAALFVDDPDPSQAGRGGDLHAKMLAGKSVSHVTTVRGYVAWLLSKLAVKVVESDMESVIALAERLIVDENAYVRWSAGVTISNLAWATRRRKPDGSFEHTSAARSRITALVFSAIEANIRTPRILDPLAGAATHLLQLDAPGASRVLQLLTAHAEGHDALSNIAWLSIYYGEFRAHEQSMPPFDAEQIRAELHEAARAGSPAMRGRIAYWVYKAFADKNEQSWRRLCPLTLVLADGPFDHLVTSFFYDVAEAWLDREPCEELDRALLRVIREHVRWLSETKGDDYIDGAVRVARVLAKKGRHHLIRSIHLEIDRAGLSAVGTAEAIAQIVAQETAEGTGSRPEVEQPA